MKLSKKLWFKRKTYGWVWAPSSWEGWLVIAVYVALLIKTFVRIDSTAHSMSDSLIAFVVPFVVSTIVLIGVCYWKGETPKWMWGEEKDVDKK